MSIRINELENKKQFKCVYLGPKIKEEKELILYPNKNGTVADLLEEAKKQIEFSEGSTGKLRWEPEKFNNNKFFNYFQ